MVFFVSFALRSNTPCAHWAAGAEGQIPKPEHHEAQDSDGPVNQTLADEKSDTLEVRKLRKRRRELTNTEKGCHLDAMVLYDNHRSTTRLHSAREVWHGRFLLPIWGQVT